MSVVAFDDGERLGYGCWGEVISLERRVQLWNLDNVNRGQKQDIRWTIFASVSFVFMRHADYMLIECFNLEPTGQLGSNFPRDVHFQARQQQ